PFEATSATAIHTISLHDALPISFFGKVIQEERREPGSVPKVFMDHPPTPDRIVKSEEEIKEILPKRDQYLVSTSEFDDVKSRMQDRKSTRLNSSHVSISYAVFCL